MSIFSQTGHPPKQPRKACFASVLHISSVVTLTVAIAWPDLILITIHSYYECMIYVCHLSADLCLVATSLQCIIHHTPPWLDL